MSRVLLPVALLVTGWLGGATAAWSAPPLPASFIADLEGLQARLEAGDLAAVRERSVAQAERLAGGNAADRWARALYLQLAAGAAARDGDLSVAADYLGQARRGAGIEPHHRDRWQHDEAGLRLAAGETREGAGLLAEWLEGHSGEARDHWRLARARAELEQWQLAAEHVRQARDMTAQLDEGQRELAVTVLRRAGDEAEALALLGGGLATSRDPERWRVAAALAQRAGNPGQAASIWEAGWRAGVLEGGADLRRLVELHLAGGTPARAAEHLEAALAEGILEDSEANRRLLAQAWERARDRERALTAWQRVAEQSGASDDWARLGQLAHAWGRDRLAERALAQAGLRPEL
ncbi:MAG: hypothetical protein ACQEXC_11260 [Pseudomonadota bacterium]